MTKSTEAFRTISEVAAELGVPKHVLRFWEGRFPQVKPMKRGGGRRYYRPEDLALLRGIRHLLHSEGYTIKGVQKILREQGIEQVKRGVEAPATPSRAAGANKGGHSAAADDSKAPKISAKRSQTGGRGRAKNRTATRTGTDTRASRIRAVIGELEDCRAMLTGSKKRAAGAAARAKAKR